jgi:TonB-linked SusC/RagA family outer membrane protein
MRIHAYCGLFYKRKAFTKTLRIVRLTAILIFLGCMAASAKGFTQKITLYEKDAPLIKVLHEIEKQSGYQFFFSDGDLKLSNPITIEAKNADFADVLQQCFKNQPLSYEIVNNTVVVKLRGLTTALQPQDSVPRKLVRMQGVVFNESGEPLSGANVTIKETQKGTITNAKGEFDLGPIPVGSTVIVSFIGYLPQTMKISEARNLKIYLKVAKNELDKVVVQAYGLTSQRLTTGDIATVTAEQIERQPEMNALAALQGQVPGLVITQTSGYASAPFKVEIRGRSVLNGNLASEPLYIIDGVPLTVVSYGNNGGYTTGSPGITQNGFTGPAGGQSPFFSINPADIESITVLKDADATSIYGSRGANGVILITTKKGQPGKTKFTINAYQGSSEVTNHYDLLNTQQYLEMRREAFKNDQIAPNAGNAYDMLVWDTTRSVDWQKVLWGRIAPETDIELALSGGDKQTTFRIGGGYHRQSDILTASGANQRASLSFNLSHKSLNQRLSTSFTSSLSYTQSDLLNVPNAVNLPPDAPPIYDNIGQLNFAGWAPNQNGFPFGTTFQPYTAKTDLINNQFEFHYSFFKGFYFSTSLGYSLIHNSQIQIYPIKAQNPALSPYGSAFFGNNNNANYIVEPQLEYKTFLAKGQVDAVAGGTMQSASSDGNTIRGMGYTDDNLLRSISAAGSTSASTGSGTYKYTAGFMRINYNWEDRYILNLSARRDGSSLFGPGHQFGNFGSIGAAWIFSEENWIKNKNHFLSFGKLSGSYGTTGSDNLPQYSYLSQWAPITPNYQPGLPSYSSTLLPNPNVEWQSNHKLEGALDLGFLRDRLTIKIAFYRNRCGNQLVTSPLAAITGFTSVVENLPALIQNQGWELTLRYKAIDAKTFSWTNTFKIGINNNKLLKFPNLAQSPYASSYTVGESLNIGRLLHFTGVDPLNGQYTYADKNHNGQIDWVYTPGVPDDLYDKDMSVKFDGSFGTEFVYKTLQLNLLFIFREQLLPNAQTGSNPGTMFNQSVEVLNRWQKPGDVAQFARFTTQGGLTDQVFQNSDGDYSNGSYIRLRNVSLSYDFPAQFDKRTWIDGLSLYLRAENLFVLTRYNGLDPEASTFGSLPPAKTLTVGLKVNL